MIIYIHGFGGSGKGVKATLFRKYFKKQNIEYIAPSLSYSPELAIETLQELIISYKSVSLIGSSLGGYYATYLSQMSEVKRVVLINPSINPVVTLDKYRGLAINFYDQSHFEWNLNHIDSLKKFKVKELNIGKFLLLLQKGDEILNYKEAYNKFTGAKIIVEDGGNHGFKGIERHFEKIKGFLI